ncbi:MAG TPA: hypothetical protein VGF29_14770 [Hyphomicrobiaceae bacterium]|jgi:hypothetical protein
MPNPDSKLTATIEALLGRLRQSDIDALPPARRHRLGTLLRDWADRCERTGGSKAGDDYSRGRAPVMEGIDVEDYPDS